MQQPAINYAWWNGQVVPINQILVSPFDRGLLYGDGLFETLRTDNGRIWHLERHISRLESSAEELKFKPESFPLWHSIIQQLLEVNGLDGPARIKILITRGRQMVLGLPEPREQTIMVTAISFNPPSDEELKRGVEGRISSQWITPQLARHKTCNYLPFLCANEEVKEQGGEIAILKDREDRISEATTAALVFTRGDTWVFPLSQWQLPSTTAEVLAERLEGRGKPIENRPVFEEEIASFDGCWLLSSSMGARPVNLPHIPVARTDRVALTHMINELIYS